jgi:hypothetical protein
MELFLIFVLFVIVIIQWRSAANRMDRREEEDRLRFINLTQRVHALESELQRRTPDAPAAAPPITRPAPVDVPPPLPVPPPVVWQTPWSAAAPSGTGLQTWAPDASPTAPPVARPAPVDVPPPLPVPPPVDVPPPLPWTPPAPVQPSAPVFVAPTAEESQPVSRPVREKPKPQEWEAIVGGNWLLKVGVILTVIGIALFLAYSFAHMGPAGRVGVSLAVSLAMLIAGVIVERLEPYRLFGRGLIGGGWAALYTTVYAMQALEAAKVITNDLLGATLLLVVAVGMIVHSLKYRSQTVSGLAYFIAFGTLAITPLTAFSVLALIPLAASLLYVAYRFGWSEMALFGLLATYGTCASRGDTGAPLWSALTVFSIYWLLFEAFDLMRAARRSDRPAERALMPFNALAFMALAFYKCSKAAPDNMYLLAAGIAAAYLLSTAIRTRLRPPSSFTPEKDTIDRAFAGGYEGTLTLSAILAAAAVLLKLNGGWANAGLFVEAEILFIAGLFFREAYPRRLAAALFTTGIGRLLIFDTSLPDRITVAGWSVRHWTPSAALAGALFYINRALRKTDVAYGYAAAAVFALIIACETPERFIGLGLLSFAAMVFAFGWTGRLLDFRIQGYAVSALGFLAIAIYQSRVAQGIVPAPLHPWISVTAAAVLAYAAALCALRSAPDRFRNLERDGLRFLASWAATASIMALAWRILPPEYLGLGWMAAALPLLELGLRGLPRDFQAQSYVIASAGALYVLFYNVIPVHNDAPLPDRLLILWSSLVAYLFASRTGLQACPPRVTDISSGTGTLFLMTALWALLPAIAIGPAWAAVALILLEIGFLIDFPGIRLQGHIAGAAAFGRLFFANFDVAGKTAGISHRLITVVPVIASYYYQWQRQREETSRLRQWERAWGRFYLYAAAIVVTVLLRFELGRTFTVVGWALFALILIAAGQRWNNADLRWQSYAIAALAFWRSWTTDFWAPGDFSAMPGRVATGALVIACFFAAQLLIPQMRRGRLFYSLLATVLLTILLYHEVSGSFLTMAWGAEGLVLLAVGFPLRDRTLRLSGLTLFMVCILKLFVYDLRNLETLYRILSFIVLGVILVGVSWAYTRFRDHVKRYL